MLVVIADNSEVVFGYGLQSRIERYLDFFQYKKNGISASDESKASNDEVWSLLLNPTEKDSLSFTAQLRLALAYGPNLKDQKPLSNFLWFADYPKVKLLTRPKNAISKEGEKPPGESSIIGAFSSRGS